MIHRRTWLLATVGLTLALLVSALLSACQRSRPVPVPLAAVFASWYGYDVANGSDVGRCAGGLGSFHWNDTPATGGVVYTPTLGFYCSADPAVVHWQLDQIQKAGIRALFVSWWGWGDGDLDGDDKDDPYPIDGHADKSINLGVQAVLADIISNTRPISVALIVEPFPMTQAGLDVTSLAITQTEQIFQHLHDDYYYNPQYRNLWFQWPPSAGAKPLVITFDPLKLPPKPDYTLRYWTGGPKPPAETRSPWNWFFAPEQDVSQRISDDGVAFVHPRFDEYYLWSDGAGYIKWTPRRLDPDLKLGLYEQQWQTLIDNREQVKLIVLYSWNLYGEQAQIEPSTGVPAPVESDYVRKTRDYYRAFATGCPTLRCK